MENKKINWKPGFAISLGIIVAVIVLFMFRDEYQPVLLFLRKYIFVVLIAILSVVLATWRFRQGDKPWKRVLVIVVTVLWFGSWYFLYPGYHFLHQYYIYSHLDMEEIHTLPLTKNERIQPQNNITTMGYETVSETKEVSEPHLVRVDGDNKWTMAVQPAKEYSYQRYMDDIEEIFSVSSTAPFPSFSGSSRNEVIFQIGESLYFSRNTYNACVKRFNLWQLFTLEPDQVYYMKDDDGDWVQVVSLIRWRGFFFPHPEFGGVMVIENGKHDFQDVVERTTIGKGTYIPPSQTHAYPYLTGQNIVSEKVSRTYAETFMFLGGFDDPMPWRRLTAVKIPDLPLDQNKPPFVTDFDFSGVGTATSGLYHYFGLEPLGEDRTGLSVSVFIPADGLSTVYFYNHGDKKEGLAGVSAMPTKIKESKKEYDWTANAPVEFRPYIRDIEGQRRLFWLATVVTLRTETTQFDGSATPELVVGDARYKDVVWLDAAKPETWVESITERFSTSWKANETDGIHVCFDLAGGSISFTGFFIDKKTYIYIIKDKNKLLTQKTFFTMKIKDIFEIWDEVVAQVEGSENSDQSTKTTQIAQDFFHKTGVKAQAIVPLDKITAFAQEVQWYTIKNLKSSPAYLKSSDQKEKEIKDLQWESEAQPLRFRTKKAYITEPSKAAWKFTLGWFVFCLFLCIIWTWWWIVPFFVGLVINWVANPYFHLESDYNDNITCKTDEKWKGIKKLFDNDFKSPKKDEFEQITLKTSLLSLVVDTTTKKEKGLRFLSHNSTENKELIVKIIQGGHSPSMMIHTDSFILKDYWNKEGTPFTSETLLPICYVERDGYAIVFSGLEGRTEKTQIDIRNEVLQGINHEETTFDGLTWKQAQSQWELFKTIYQGVLDNLSHKEIEETVCRGIYQKLRSTSETFQSNMQNMEDNFLLMASLPENNAEKVAEKVLDLGGRKMAKGLSPKETLEEVNSKLQSDNEQIVQELFNVVTSLSLLKNTGEDSHKLLSCFSNL